MILPPPPFFNRKSLYNTNDIHFVQSSSNLQSQINDTNKNKLNNNYSSSFYEKKHTKSFNKNNTNKTLYFNENNNDEKRNPEHKESEFLDIFGIKLYFDDILIICLLFFLYQENVDDQYLFIALILLLLS